MMIWRALSPASLTQPQLVWWWPKCCSPWTVESAWFHRYIPLVGSLKMELYTQVLMLFHGLIFILPFPVFLIVSVPLLPV